ncbi:PLAT/LH2 domain-containing protein [Saccharothrix sp.]|uniref:lipase family protein n=1 Tax=Saccharothrix sp. TaxID=1873460 RepID=UPI002811375C|nr:PLAT/LH2 domain-containing protein [Saccharothrix sp.]
MAIDWTKAVEMALYASEAYKSYYEDALFVTGYQRLDGAFRQAADRETWLKGNAYKAIENPAGTSLDTRFMGIVTTAADGSLVVAFRGSATRGDWATNMSGLWPFWTDKDWVDASVAFAAWQPMLGNPNTLLVHNGFLARYLLFRDSVRRHVEAAFGPGPKPPNLYVTGHSLGGALATICALDLAASPGVLLPRPILHTFGAPRVGDHAFAGAVQDRVTGYRIWNRQDVVTRLPARGYLPAPDATRWASYEHAGTEGVLGSDGVEAGAHYLDTYYAECVLRGPEYQVRAGVRLAPDDRITSLTVRIKTANSWGAGTNNDVFIDLLGTRWGPLDRWGNDFEAGATGEYDLFAMFPDKVAGNSWTGRDLKDVGLFLGSGPGDHYNVFTHAWTPSWIEIEVNGRSLPKAFVNGSLSIGNRYAFASLAGDAP